ncbi:MAG: hypothetical protein KIT11_09145 [Fimbriimonadaceae bacterium]|nr:hypothetical protein [Fimbriimonadaceae bacterium]QYK55493.1 MAG: hypothetical protein KF733_10815 [Fimbriimonadaceae bacterium]
MALSKAFETYERPGLVVSYKMSNVKIYKGANVGVNTLGYAIPMSHATASLKFVGVANETVDNTGGAAGDKVVNVTKSGSFVFKAASGFNPAQADVGKEVYALTDWEVQSSTSGLTNQYKVGTVVSIESTSTGVAGVRVRIDNYSV